MSIFDKLSLRGSRNHHPGQSRHRVRPGRGGRRARRKERGDASVNARDDAPADAAQQSGRTASGAHRQAAEHSPRTTQGRLKVSAAEGVRAAVLAHIGLTIASEWMFTPELRSGAVLSEWCLPPIDLWAAFPTGRAATAKARAFVDFFEHSSNPEPQLSKPSFMPNQNNF
jgi:DNA-binding transcriptional LysR family regulator